MGRYTTEHSRRIRARRAGVVNMGGITKERVYERDNGICCICGNWVAKSDATIDHVYPISRGGPHTMGNVGIAHHRCNQYKSNRTILELDAEGIRDKLRKGILT